MQTDTYTAVHQFHCPRPAPTLLLIKETLAAETASFEILLGDSLVSEFKLEWPQQRDRFCKSIHLDETKLMVCGMFIPRGGQFALDAYWNSRILPGSASYPPTYCIPLLAFGMAHIASGVSGGILPLGGLFQALGCNFGSIFFGLALSTLGLTAKFSSADVKKRGVFDLARLTGIGLVVADGLASIAWMYLLATKHVPQSASPPVAAIAYLFPAAMICMVSLTSGLSKPPKPGAITLGDSNTGNEQC